jgi:hypothetical protein
MDSKPQHLHSAGTIASDDFLASISNRHVGSRVLSTLLHTMDNPNVKAITAFNHQHSKFRARNTTSSESVANMARTKHATSGWDGCRREQLIGLVFKFLQVYDVFCFMQEVPGRVVRIICIPGKQILGMAPESLVISGPGAQTPEHHEDC